MKLKLTFINDKGEEILDRTYVVDENTDLGQYDMVKDEAMGRDEAIKANGGVVPF